MDAKQKTDVSLSSRYLVNVTGVTSNKHALGSIYYGLRHCLPVKKKTADGSDKIKR